MVSAIPANAISLITSFLGDEKDDIQFIYYGGVVASAAVYPLISRFSRYFKKRQLLLWSVLIELLLLFITTITQNNLQLFICNFLLSSVKMVGLITCMGIFLKKFNPSNSRGILYGMYYSIAFSLGQISSYLISLILQTYSWKDTFIISIPGIFISLLIIVFCMHSQRMEKKYPLYQIDWIGYLLFIAASLSLSFVCIYGERYYWLQSPLIIKMIGATLLGYALWLWRVLTVRRPYVDVRVLVKYKHVSVGIALMIALYLIYNTFNISNEFMKVNLGYTDSYLAATNLYLIISFVIFIPLTGLWLHHVHRVRESLFVGFMLFAVYYIYTATLFYPEENDSFFMIPMIIRGAAFGISITSLSYYASVNIPVHENSSRAFFSIISRTVIAAPISTSLWINRFTFLKQNEVNIMNAQFVNDDIRVSGMWSSLVSKFLKSGSSIEEAHQMANANIHGLIYKQALIASAQNIYYILALISIIFAILVLSLKILNIHYEKDKNKYSLTFMDL
jgi:hypothetical protein